MNTFDVATLQLHLFLCWYIEKKLGKLKSKIFHLFIYLYLFSCWNNMDRLQRKEPRWIINFVQLMRKIKMWEQADNGTFK